MAQKPALVFLLCFVSLGAAGSLDPADDSSLSQLFLRAFTSPSKEVKEYMDVFMKQVGVEGWGEKVLGPAHGNNNILYDMWVLFLKSCSIFRIITTKFCLQDMFLDDKKRDQFNCFKNIASSLINAENLFGK